MLLFYIRHGDPVYDPDSLTPLGERQAEALAKRLALYGIDRIYASSSGRAQLTAKPTCELLKKEMTVLDWCNEKYVAAEFGITDKNGNWNWGFQDADTIAQFCAPEVAALGERWAEHPYFEGKRFGEGLDRIAREVRGFMANEGYVWDEEREMYRTDRVNTDRVALFAHQGFGMAFLSCLLHIPYPQFVTRFDLCHSGMTVIDVPRREYTMPRTLTLSNDAHLYREGLPTKYNGYVTF